MTKARDLANASTALSAVSATELAFVDGVTSAIQTQIDAKAPSSTAVTLTGTQTLTNKTLTSPALTTPTISTATTNGDILYGTGSGALARLGIGTTDQVLKVTAGVPAWATPATASSGFVFVNSTSFSNVASVSIDSVFTSTYDTYMIDVMNVYGGTATDDFYFQYRYGTTTQTTAYYGSWVYWRPSTDAITGSRWRNGAQHILNDFVGDSNSMTHGNIYISQVGVAGRPSIWGATGNTSSEGFESFGGSFDGTSQVFNGFLLKSSSSNITGTVRIYGLAKS
jgi:hypothetical protein